MKLRILLSLIFLLLGLLIYGLASVDFFRGIQLVILLRNYAPDFCWGISFYFASISLIYKSFQNSSIIAAFYVMVIAFLFELSQLFHIVNGYYDNYDVLIYLLSVIISYLMEKFIRRYKNEES